MPKYRVLEKSFIDNYLREAGDEIEFDGEPGENLEPVDSADESSRKKRKSASEDSEA